MKPAKYPTYDQHRAKHVALTDQVTDLMKKYQKGELVLSTTVSNFLADWLTHHIKEDNTTFIRYFQAHTPTAKA
jgi:hemerythrin